MTSPNKKLKKPDLPVTDSPVSFFEFHLKTRASLDSSGNVISIQQPKRVSCVSPVLQMNHFERLWTFPARIGGKVQEQIVPGGGSDFGMMSVRYWSATSKVLRPKPLNTRGRLLRVSRKLGADRLTAFHTKPSNAPLQPSSSGSRSVGRMSLWPRSAATFRRANDNSSAFWNRSLGFFLSIFRTRLSN